jgi:hypothetical protein
MRVTYAMLNLASAFYANIVLFVSSRFNFTAGWKCCFEKHDISFTMESPSADPWTPPYTQHPNFTAWGDQSITELREPKFGCIHLTLFMVVSAR